MRGRSLIIALVLIACALSVADAQAASSSSDVPAIVTRGLEAYQSQGLAAALDIWLEDSPAALDPAAKPRMIQSVAPLEAAYGKMIGAEVLEVVGIGESVRRVYLTLRLERGPIYSYIDCYRAASGAWIVPVLMFNSRPNEILPRKFWGG